MLGVPPSAFARDEPAADRVTDEGSLESVGSSGGVSPTTTAVELGDEFDQGVGEGESDAPGAEPAGELTPEEPASPAQDRGLDRNSKGQWVLPLERTGVTSVDLSGQLSRADLFVPVPRGLVPVAFRARVRLSPDVEDGFIEGRSEDRELGVVSLGGESGTPSGGKVVLPLTDAQVRDGVVPLTLLSRLRSVDDVCSTTFRGARLSLEDPSLLLEGEPIPPTSVGAFFPEVLTRFEVFVPPEPSVAQADAALGLAAMVVSRYRTQNPHVELRTLEDGQMYPDIADQPTVRSVVIRPNEQADDAEIEIVSARSGGHMLVLSGDGEALSRQSKALAGEFRGLVIGPNVRVLELREPEDLSVGRRTFDMLGFPSLQLSGTGRMDLPLSFSLFDLGGPVRDLKMRLAGTYTPVSGDAEATLSILFNEVLIRTADLGERGSFDMTMGLPNSLLRRENIVNVRIDHTPPQGNCRVGVHPFTFQVSPSSHLDVGRGQSLPPGFERFPQVLRQGFVVAFDTSDLFRLRLAYGVVAALQRLVGEPLEPRVVSWDDALEGDMPALFVSEAGDHLGPLDPPFMPRSSKIVDLEGEEILRVDIGAPFAVLEAFEHAGRDVALLAYRDDPSLARFLIDHIAEDERGWFGLTGDIFLQPSSGPPVGATIRGGVLRAEPLGEQASSLWSSLRPLVFGAQVLAVLLFAAWGYPRLVRRRPRVPDEP